MSLVTEIPKIKEIPESESIFLKKEVKEKFSIDLEEEIKIF